MLVLTPAVVGCDVGFAAGACAGFAFKSTTGGGRFAAVVAGAGAGAATGAAGAAA
jgi:hypothetical protein